MSGKKASNNPGLCPNWGENRAFVAGLGHEIKPSARFQGPRHSAKCWLSNQRFIIIIIIIIIIKLQLGWHPVAVVQYTFKHKQYTEYRGQNIHNN
jgi:hypothetical protein